MQFLQKTVILLFLSIVLTQQKINLAPVIGVIMNESSYKDEGYPPSEYSYIAASYIKFVEMAGARAVPVQYDGDKAYYDSVFDQINGLLIPGGSQEFPKGSELGDNLEYLVQKAMKANDNGDFFPIWGTCNGFEILTTIVAKFADILTHIDDEGGVNHTLQIQNPGRLYSNMSNYLYQNVQTQAISYFNHSFCLTVENFNKNADLSSFFTLLATAKNDLGEEFVASVESQKYPIYAVQFHPEKNIFEWKIPANHSVEAVKNSQYYADYFIQLSRNNFHEFVSEEELDAALIYNYNPVQLSSSSFEQVYMFKNFKSQNNKKSNVQKMMSKFLKQ